MLLGGSHHHVTIPKIHLWAKIELAINKLPHYVIISILSPRTGSCRLVVTLFCIRWNSSLSMKSLPSRSINLNAIANCEVGSEGEGREGRGGEWQEGGEGREGKGRGGERGGEGRGGEGRERGGEWQEGGEGRRVEGYTEACDYKSSNKYYSLAIVSNTHWSVWTGGRDSHHRRSQL